MDDDQGTRGAPRRHPLIRLVLVGAMAAWTTGGRAIEIDLPGWTIEASRDRAGSGKPGHV